MDRDANPDAPHRCPYCGRPLRWISQRWFGRGTYECDECGDFPDLAVTSVPRREAAANVPVGKPPARPSHRRDLRPVVLLVDDSAEYRDLYAVLLEQTATVITASRGEDARATEGQSDHARNSGRHADLARRPRRAGHRRPCRRRLRVDQTVPRGAARRRHSRGHSATVIS
jgi:hypothetical protein